VHEALHRVRQAWDGTPYEGQAWLVGGWVRDTLLGLPEPNDIDVVVLGDALDAAQTLVKAGIANGAPVLYPRFRTATVQVGDLTIEVAQARKESYSKDSRKPRVEPATLLEDAQRRDFTVNALMRSLWDDQVSDPLGTGLRDLEDRILRTPQDPRQTFSDDPLRMLRAVRFKWQLRGFRLAPGLKESIVDNALRLQIVSAERVRDETVRILGLVEADRALSDLLALGLLGVFAPDLAAMRGVEQGGPHHLDVFDHTCLVVRNVGPHDLVLTLAALLHDVGKPRTRSVDHQGRTRFLDHERVGAEIAKEWLQAMRFPGDTVSRVSLLVKNHMRLAGLKVLSPAAVRRLARDLGQELDRLICLIEADANALRPGTRSADLKPLRDQVKAVLEQTPLTALVSPLDGKEIMRLTGLKAGPDIGSIKRRLTELVIEGEIKPGDKDAAKAWVLNAHATRQADESSCMIEDHPEA
jgi:poly(A) polymerase